MRDKQKIRAELEQLVADRERRIAEKIENGTAIRGSVGRVIGVDDSKPVPPSRDERGREIFYEVDTIITGVPRDGRHLRPIRGSEPTKTRGRFLRCRGPL